MLKYCEWEASVDPNNVMIPNGVITPYNVIMFTTYIH